MSVNCRTKSGVSAGYGNFWWADNPHERPHLTA